MKSRVSGASMAIALFLFTGCADDAGPSSAGDGADVTLEEDGGDIGVPGPGDAQGPPDTIAHDDGVAPLLDGAEEDADRVGPGFPLDEQLSAPDCPKLILPVADESLAGDRPACALASPPHEKVTDASGANVAPGTLIGQPTVLWFFPAPLTPG